MGESVASNAENWRSLGAHTQHGAHTHKINLFLILCSIRACACVWTFRTLLECSNNQVQRSHPQRGRTCPYVGFQCALIQACLNWDLFEHSAKLTFNLMRSTHRSLSRASAASGAGPKRQSNRLDNRMSLSQMVSSLK